MFGMMHDGTMMTWGMGIGMGLVVVVLALGAVALGKYILSRCCRPERG